MSMNEILTERSGSTCELCSADTNLEVYIVPPHSDDNADHAALLCTTCLQQINSPDTLDANHWRCLNDSMWSQIPAVQVLAYRLLSMLRGEGWPAELLDMLYLEDDILAWAKDGLAQESSTSSVKHVDCNGAVLAQGDAVTIIKDLKVKGGGFTAKRGTLVRNISLDPNAEQVEGKVSGQQIVIYTKFVKKA
jgi:protein PhnA